MDRTGTQMWTWTLVCVFVSWISVSFAAAGPYYTVTIPAILEARADSIFCVALMKPNETLVMTVTLRLPGHQLTLFEETSTEEFKKCITFQVPAGDNVVTHLEVEVRGQTFYSKEVRKVMIKTYKPMTFIQTDKPLYVPGQTVHFRVVSVDTKFRPAVQLYNKIQIEEPNRKRIGQWLNETSDGKILQLSYKLNSEAHVGTYSIIVLIGEDKTQYTFNVLPKFEVTINATQELAFFSEAIAGVCAKYTYGQPVPGNISAELCQPQDLTSHCLEKIKKADELGCAEFIFNIASFPKLRPLTLKLNVSVEEEGTGITHKAEKEIEILTPPLLSAEEAFGPNIIGTVTISVLAIGGGLIISSDLPILLWQSKQMYNNIRGVKKRSVDDQSLHHHEHLGPAGHTFWPLDQDSSPGRQTVSSLEVQTRDHPIPCGTSENIIIKYTIVGEKQGSAAVSYVVLSRGAIIKQGFSEIEVQDQPVTEGQMSIELTVSPEMAPHVRIVVYTILPSLMVITSKTDFDTEKCFSHKVSLDFSKNLSLPGDENTLKVTAHSGALCGVSIVDQSVFIKEPRKTLDAEKIFAMLPVTKVSSVPYEVQDPHDCLTDFGLKMATNLDFSLYTCIQNEELKYNHNPNGLPERTEPVPIETVQKFSPETWLWDLVETGASGTKDLPLTVPETLTTWETEAFCLSSQGLGLAPRKKLAVFQPFVLELNLPYSINLWEHSELKATVFNHLSSCIMVSAIPAPSFEYTLTQIPGEEYTNCVCGNEHRTFEWILTPKFIGNVRVSVTAEAKASDVKCHNEVVVVPERGRSTTVSRTLKVEDAG